MSGIGRLRPNGLQYGANPATVATVGRPAPGDDRDGIRNCLARSARGGRPGSRRAGGYRSRRRRRAVRSDMARPVFHAAVCGIARQGIGAAGQGRREAPQGGFSTATTAAIAIFRFMRLAVIVFWRRGCAFLATLCRSGTCGRGRPRTQAPPSAGLGRWPLDRAPARPGTAGILPARLRPASAGVGRVRRLRFPGGAVPLGNVRAGRPRTEAPPSAGLRSARGSRLDRRARSV